MYVSSTFDFLRPQSIIESEEAMIVKESYDYVLKYQSDIGSEFTSQLLSLKEMIINKHLKTIGELATFILENDFSFSYCEVLGACMLFLILPVTVATAERSFSKLKLIKNFANVFNISSVTTVFAKSLSYANVLGRYGLFKMVLSNSSHVGGT